jgi:hypothetical protein
MPDDPKNRGAQDRAHISMSAPVMNQVGVWVRMMVSSRFVRAARLRHARPGPAGPKEGR